MKRFLTYQLVVYIDLLYGLMWYAKHNISGGRHDRQGKEIDHEIERNRRARGRQLLSYFLHCE